MKLAIVHDKLLDAGGSERIFQYMCEEFAEADAYTLAFNPKTTIPYFSSLKIHTSCIDPFVRSTAAFHWSFPLAILAMQGLDLSGYDVVLSSCATVAKFVTTGNARHICYCYIPTRALWHSDEYFRWDWKRRLLRPVLDVLRNRDYLAAQKVDHFIGISNTSRDYIRQYYNRDAGVIYCPVDLSNFRPNGEPKDHYLIVSRLEAWKRLDYAIEAFNRLKLPVRIVGTGSAEAALRAMAGPTVEFVGWVDDATLSREYSEARAVLFTPFLEYGLVPIEANACGTPVICYGLGGTTETMVPLGNASGLPPTAVFFHQQTPEAVVAAVREFEHWSFDKDALIRHASKFGVPEFKRRLRDMVVQAYQRNQN
jgi:glycosyltransferase involved in cell wall biosynthesis